MDIGNDKPIEHAAAGQAGADEPVDELLLARYIEGRLDKAECHALEEMLRVNAAARRRLDALREEERLLAEALETLSEPSKRLGDKVVATLHAEERARLQALRTRRVRRHVFAMLAAAASLVLCIWLIRPRDSMGTAVSGTPATLRTINNDVRAFTKDSRFYEGDSIITAQGQFVRLRLANGTLLDLDEHSRLHVEKSKPVPAFRLECGRMGLNAPQGETLIRLSQGTVRASAGALADIWLPRPVETVWPVELEPVPGTAQPPAATGEYPAVVTVLSGTVYIANQKLPSGVPVSRGCRAVFGPQTRSIAALDLAASHVLESRQGKTWHALDGVSPQDRTVIGLFEPPDFEDLGQRLNMAGNTTPAVAKAVTEALALLQAATQTAAPAQARAEQLAAAQQALRVAYAPLKATDDHRALGRLVEGLAHLERGRALMACSAAAASAAAREKDRSAAAAAFDAARVAFEEALNVDSGAPVTVDPKSDWARQLAAGPSVTLRELSPANQAALLGISHHALARYWLARAAGPGASAEESDLKADSAGAVEAAREFDALRGALSRSVEALAVRLAEGLSLEAAGDVRAQEPGPEAQAKTLRGKAVEALEEVLAAPLAGWNEQSRRCGEGLRQAALLALVRTHLANHDAAQARAAADDFRILYPLDTAGPVAREIARLLQRHVLLSADAALQAGQHQAAAEAYDAWLSKAQGRAANDPTVVSARLQLLKALIALKDGGRARQEAAALAAVIPPESKAELDALAAQAAALPDVEPQRPVVPQP